MELASGRAVSDPTSDVPGRPPRTAIRGCVDGLRMGWLYASASDGLRNVWLRGSMVRPCCASCSVAAARSEALRSQYSWLRLNETKETAASRV